MNSQTFDRDRSLRVYVSSSYRDMNAERDELVRHVFPQLQKFCEQRGVTFTGVVMQWGITQEQAELDEVLPICLAEIDRCRPYFIGLLGERYGSVPSQIPHELLEEEPWLAEFRDRSITELEILHGALNPADTAQAYFYFRDPHHSEGLPLDRRVDFEEQSDAARLRMAGLKSSIRQSGFPLRENYPDAHTFGRFVLEDLVGAIDRLFPRAELPDPLDRTADQHEAFARSRTRACVAQERYFPQLDAHAGETSPPLVIIGDAGSGKSALLASWSRHYRDGHPEEFALIHFLDAGSDSSDWMALLRRIMQELKRRFHIASDIPTHPTAIRGAFSNWLDMASSKGRVVLVLDGLDRLSIRDGAADLAWLPPMVPSNIRLILSSLPGRSLDELVRRGWPRLHIQPLTVQERLGLIRQYLALHAKRLSKELAQRIPLCQRT